MGNSGYISIKVGNEKEKYKNKKTNNKKITQY